MALKFTIAIDDKGNPVIVQLGQNVNKLDKNMEKLSSTAKQVGAAFAAYFAADKIVSFGVASVKAFDASVVAQAKLNTALGYTSSAINEQSSVLQGLTRFEDDNIMSMQGLLATYRLSESQILRLTPAILDMATATGMDLDAAAQKVGKSIAGKTNALARDGIEIDKNLTSSQKMEAVLGKLNERYEGQAQAITKLAGGPIIALGNKFDDLQENIGRIITQNPFFEAAMSIADKVLGKLLVSTGAVEQGFTDLDFAIDGEVLPTFVNLNETMLAGIPVVAAYGQTLASYKTLKFGSSEAITEAMKSIETVAAQSDATLVNYKNRIVEINARIAESAKRKNPRKGIAEDSDEEVDRGGIDKEINNIVDRYSTENQTVSEYLQERALLRLEYSDAEAEASAKEVELFAWKYSEEKKYNDLSIQMEQQRKLNMINTVGTMIGAFAQLNTALKGNAKLSQALLIGETIMNTSAAIMKILAQGGIFATPLAIAAGITGAAQVATIASQKFADGGWTSGNGNSRSDNIPAMLSPGERVVSVREVQRMGGRDAVDRAVSAGTRNSGNVNVYIQGNVIGNKEFTRDLITSIDAERSR